MTNIKSQFGHVGHIEKIVCEVHHISPLILGHMCGLSQMSDFLKYVYHTNKKFINIFMKSKLQLTKTMIYLDHEMQFL